MTCHIDSRRKQKGGFCFDRPAECIWRDSMRKSPGPVWRRRGPLGNDLHMNSYGGVPRSPSSARRRSPLNTQWVRRRASFCFFLSFGDDIVRASYFFRPFSGLSTGNRVVFLRCQQGLASSMRNVPGALKITRFLECNPTEAILGAAGNAKGAPGGYMAQATSRVQPSLLLSGPGGTASSRTTQTL